MPAAEAAPAAPPADPRLPALAALRDAGADTVLGALGVPVEGVRLSVLKAHPGSRCTLLAEGREGRVILKAFREPPVREAEALRALGRRGLASGRAPTAAPLLAESVPLRLLVVGCLGGPTAAELVAAGGGARAGALAGAWLGAAAAVPVPEERPTAAAVLRDAHKWVRAVSEADARLGARAAAVAATLEARPPATPRPVVAHGSLSANHVIDLGDGPGVIDTDRLAGGPLERDAARFLGTLARLAGGRPELAAEAGRAEAALLAEAGDLLDGAALAWYRAAALLKDAKYLAARRPDGWHRRAAGLLAEAGGHAEG